MPRLTNIRAEKFCLALISGKSEYDAAKEAGYSESYAKDTRLIRKGKGVIERITELQKEVEKTALRTSAQRLKMLDDITDTALDDGDLKTAVKAIEAANKMVPDALAAHRTVNENHNKNVDMTLEEANEFLDVLIGD